MHCFPRKNEKELVASETARCTKLRIANAELLDKNKKQAFELEKFEERLKSYDSLPLPDEIKLRMKDFEEDIVRQKDACSALEEEKKSLLALLEKEQSSVQELESSLQEKQADIAALAAKVRMMIIIVKRFIN